MAFEASREQIRAGLLEHIQKLLSSRPSHFVWRRGNCPYDSSGFLKEDGKVSLNQTVAKF